MITLPWPAKECSPNWRGHWSKKSKAAKSMRQIAGWETKVSKIKVIWDGEIHLHITMNPPDNRRRDEDNMRSSLKNLMDGVADGLGVNDNRFRLHHIVGEVVKGGRVTVEIKQEKA